MITMMMIMMINIYMCSNAPFLLDSSTLFTNYSSTIGADFCFCFWVDGGLETSLQLIPGRGLGKEVPYERGSGDRDVFVETFCQIYSQNRFSHRFMLLTCSYSDSLRATRPLNFFCVHSHSKIPGSRRLCICGHCGCISVLVVCLCSCSIGNLQTSNTDELIRLSDVGLAGHDGTLGRWKVKTFATLLTENDHLNVRLPRSCSINIHA